MTDIEPTTDTATDAPPAGAEGDLGPDPAKAGLIAFHEALAAGSTRDIASDEFFGRVLRAAAAGDERAIWRPNDRQRETLAKG